MSEDRASRRFVVDLSVTAVVVAGAVGWGLREWWSEPTWCYDTCVGDLFVPLKVGYWIVTASAVVLPLVLRLSRSPMWLRVSLRGAAMVGLPLMVGYVPFLIATVLIAWGVSAMTALLVDVELSPVAGARLAGAVMVLPYLALPWLTYFAVRVAHVGRRDDDGRGPVRDPTRRQWALVHLALAIGLLVFGRFPLSGNEDSATLAAEAAPNGFARLADYRFKGDTSVMWGTTEQRRLDAFASPWGGEFDDPYVSCWIPGRGDSFLSPCEGSSTVATVRGPMLGGECEARLSKLDARLKIDAEGWWVLVVQVNCPFDRGWAGFWD